MRVILSIYEQDIIPDAPVIDTGRFRKRKAARAVVSDGAGQIALLRVGLHGYHKLPGGGIDEGEDIPTALERELLEEIGCKAVVTGELGAIIEYRNQFHLEQISHCFSATLVGNKGEPDFTEKELRQQFSIVWARDIDSAITLLTQDEPTSYEGKFIQRRDLALLRAAKEVNEQGVLHLKT